MLEVHEMANYFNDKSNIKDDSYVKISGIDNGTGIPKKDLVHIIARIRNLIESRKKLQAS